MCPTQLSPQCGDNFLIGKNLGETDPVEEIRSCEPSSVLRRQLFRQCRNSLVAVARPLLVEHIFADTLADLPVHGDQCGIAGAGCLDQRADFQAPLLGRLWVPADTSGSWLIEASTPPTTLPGAHTVHRAQSLKGILIIAWGC
jgi:hypothetical protein